MSGINEHDAPENGAGESAEDRMGRLAAIPHRQAQPINYGYSTFIRWMRLIMPLLAVAVIAVVFTWNSIGDKDMIPAAGSKPELQTSKNELLNPRFESTDEKNQPYTIIAKSAKQDKQDDDLILLDTPQADMLLNSGHWVALKAKTGRFGQSSQHLLLSGDVRLFHDRGYQMETEELRIDLKDNSARSEQSVYVQGPAGTIEAAGLQAWSEKGHLIFIGPAKMILNLSSPDLNNGDL